jgi:hypothetical protein
MRIAIAATTQALDAQVERHAARAPYYVLLDTKQDLYEVNSATAFVQIWKQTVLPVKKGLVPWQT